MKWVWSSKKKSFLTKKIRFQTYLMIACSFQLKKARIITSKTSKISNWQSRRRVQALAKKLLLKRLCNQNSKTAFAPTKKLSSALAMASHASLTSFTLLHPYSTGMSGKQIVRICPITKRQYPTTVRKRWTHFQRKVRVSSKRTKIYRCWWRMRCVAIWNGSWL